MGSRSRTARGTTFGGFAFAALLVVAVSGIGLALPFDAHTPYDSLALLLLTSPGARFYRNIHYLAAQIFLVLTLFHTWDHLRRSTERRLSVAMWARVALSLPLVVFLMLSGFILRGDAESVQALRIVSTIVGDIPFAGRSLAVALFGQASGDLQVIYLHHIATATVLAWLIVAEHARSIWPRAIPVVSVFVVTAALGLFVSPTLHDGLDPLVRGPWYFLGVQELLHWTAHPGWVIALGGVVLGALFWVPRLSEERARRVKAGLAACLVAYGGITAFALLFRGENWSFAWPLSFRASGVRLESALGGPSIEALRGHDIPVVLGRREGCLYCHHDVRGLSASHCPDAIGCASCHAGNPFSLEKSVAHAGITLVPGNLSVAARTCGLSQCHPEAVDRVPRSVMTTMAGVIAVDRAVLGSHATGTLPADPRVGGSDNPTSGPVADVRALGRSPADTHLRQLCASCHLANTKREFGPLTESSRGGGCNACHLNYSGEAHAALVQYERDSRAATGTLPPAVHPDLSIDIGDAHCFGCHSRSGRISTSYEGWMEVAPGASPVGRGFSPAVARGWRGPQRGSPVGVPFSPATKRVRTLDDGRLFDFVAPDVHFEKGMRCVDCHTAREVMGDGTTHARKSAQVRIACEDCHSAGRPRTVGREGLDAQSRRILALQDDRTERLREPRASTRGPERPRGPLLATGDGRDVFLGTTVDADGTPRLVGKAAGAALDLRRPAAVCVQAAGHARLSCISCHTAWAPRCTGCHTRFDARQSAYDHLSSREARGAWLEEASDFEAAPPALGVRVVRAPDGRARETIDTFIPGMVLTVAPTQRASDAVFRRLYARTFSHTVSKGSRSCESCHNDPVALGYGAGLLRYEVSTRVDRGSAAAHGRWIFTPEHQASPYDRLPTDAWTGFLEEVPRAVWRSTRGDVRPFTADEQKRILTVGACLTCHKGDSAVMRSAISDFRATLRRVSARCLLPAWN
jgi:hypothetical protein